MKKLLTASFFRSNEIIRHYPFIFTSRKHPQSHLPESLDKPYEKSCPRHPHTADYKQHALNSQDAQAHERASGAHRGEKDAPAPEFLCRVKQ